MFCANCGKKRELKNRFCTSCGTQLEENIRQENSEQIQESVKTTSKKSISLKLNKKVLGIIAVLLVGGFFVFKGMSANG
ncbi:MAG: zinc-ribbon domain-containing protein [Turicibacter sp.]|nr:zinc-ribbon domain-containing protein [Turicibacter sp.]